MALSREVAKLTLSLDGDLAQNARIHRITQVCGGRKVNTATFELVFLTGWAPDASQPQPLRPGSAQSRLAEANKNLPLNMRRVM